MRWRPQDPTICTWRGTAWGASSSATPCNNWDWQPTSVRPSRWPHLIAERLWRSWAAARWRGPTGRGGRYTRPGSPILRALTGVDSPVDVTWVAYYSDHDLIVRPDSAQLDERRLRAVNVLIPGAGHLGILRSPLFLRSAVRLLVAGEQGPAGAPVAAPGPASPSVAA